jgi:probable rRNA maturation factor
MPVAMIDLQVACVENTLPSEQEMAHWASAALRSDEDKELTIRCVDAEESRHLNNEYRGKNKPTNVLSFPFEGPEFVNINLLGDLIICAPVIAQEATEQNKSAKSHWAHMVVHGTLHLQGYDHIENDEAETMEALEVAILKKLGYQNPYLIEDPDT